MRIALPPLALCCLLVAACTTDKAGRFPSLAPRPIEQRGDEVTPSPAAATQGTADSALTARIGTIITAAERGHAAFLETMRTSGSAIRAGARAPEGSDAWADAQTALSAAIAARGPVRDAGLALDTLRTENADRPPADQAALDTAAARLDALSAEQDAAIARLPGAAG